MGVLGAGVMDVIGAGVPSRQAAVSAWQWDIEGHPPLLPSVPQSASGRQPPLPVPPTHSHTNLDVGDPRT